MIQLETRRLTWMICGMLLLLLSLFVFGAFGARMSRGMLRPIVKFWHTAENKAEEAEGWLNKDMQSARKRIAELEAKLLNLEIQAGEEHDLRIENKQLRRQMQIAVRSSWRTITAEVMMRDPALWDYNFTIDKGSVDGITDGAVVMFGENVVGRVSRLDRHQTVVETLLSPGCHFSVILAGSTNTGVLHGATGTNSKSPYRCEIDFLPLDISVDEGGKILTSGLGGTLPGGLPVGEVVPVDGELVVPVEHARSMLRVKPYVNLSDIRFVTVVVKTQP